MNTLKLQDIKLVHRNPLHSYTLTMRKQKEIKETIPFTIAMKRIKYLGIYLPKETKDLYISSVQFSSVAQSCLTLCDPVDCNLLGFSIHGILQARILEWIAISFSRGSSRPRDRTWISCIGGRRFNL